MDTATFIMIWVPTIAACAGLCAFVAALKGLGMLPWGFAGYLLGPVGLVWVLVIPRSSERKRQIVDIRTVRFESAKREPVTLHPRAHRDRMKGQRAA